MPTLLQQDNVVSLRTAYVNDNGNLVSFCLNPADLTSLIPKGGKSWDFSWVSQDCAWLYRHMRSPSEERKLADVFPPVVENGLKPLAFDTPPVFKLLWADSGHSVALYLNGEPWAFIDEATHEGYSKGILLPKESYLKPPGKLWDQKLFEETFPDAPTQVELADS